MKKKSKIALVVSIVAILAFFGNMQRVVSVFNGEVAVAASSSVGMPTIEYAFTQEKQHPEKLLNGVIDGAKKTLDISIYSLTERTIVSAILNAKKRGVAVRIITDDQQSSGKAQVDALKKIAAAGIVVKKNSHSGLMHEKVTISDKHVVTTGSFNYSAAASTKNDEVLVVIRDETIAKDWTAEFEKMWKDTKRFEVLTLK
jgi:phosphatidylserine/phosphatidylglycerophosphate/cardiolipin synthase-like enzyme